MSEEREPYECLPEGPEHAATDYITRLLAGLLLVLIVMVLFALSQPAEAGENLCDEYARGWELGICWRRSDCYVPAVMCPIGLEDADQAYMAGLRDGLKAGRVEL